MYFHLKNVVGWQLHPPLFSPDWKSSTVYDLVKNIIIVTFEKILTLTYFYERINKYFKVNKSSFAVHPLLVLQIRRNIKTANGFISP